jgi:hypothetical protein
MGLEKLWNWKLENGDIMDVQNRTSQQAGVAIKRVKQSIAADEHDPVRYVTAMGKKYIVVDDMRAIRSMKPVPRVVGLLPTEGVVVGYGRPKSNKSTFFANAAIDISNGDKVLGVWPSHQCEVLYIDGEQSKYRLANRILNLVDGKRCKTDHIRFRNDGRINLKDEDCRKEIEREIIANNYKVVFLDPWGKMGVRSRSNDDEVARVVNVLHDWAKKHHMLFVVITHSNKVGKAIKGSSVLIEDAELAMFIDRAGDNISSVKVTDSRGEQEDPQGFWKAGDKPFYFEQVIDPTTKNFYLRMSDGNEIDYPRTICGMLQGGKEMTREAIAKDLGMKAGTVYKILAEHSGMFWEVAKETRKSGSGGRRNIYRLIAGSGTKGSRRK